MENRIIHGRKRQASVNVGAPRKIPFRETQENCTAGNNLKPASYGRLQELKFSVGPKAWAVWDLKGFNVEEHLGKGGFADVYKVRDKRSGYLYALKHQKLRADDTDEELELESKILGNLTHPNIVRCHCSFRTELAMNLVLEYCESGNLFEVMSSTSKNLTNEM